MTSDDEDGEDVFASLSRMYLEHWQAHGGLNTPPPRSENPPAFPPVFGFHFATSIAILGCVLNFILIVILFRKKFTVLAWFSIGIAICDLFSCLSYAFGEIVSSVRQNIRWDWIPCSIIISKSPFWVSWALRMGLIVMESWYIFTQLIFPIVYRRHGRRSIMMGMLIFYALQAWLAYFVHSLTSETGRYHFCYEAMDLFRLYGDEIGNHKLLVALHIAMGFIVPVMFTRFLYCNMLEALAESPNPYHLLTYNEMQKIYFMDNLLVICIWGPFYCLFFVFHFGSFFEFTQKGGLHKLTFGVGLAYHALYPLLCLYFKRDVGGHLMGSLDVSKGHWVITEDDDREEFFGNTVERIPTPWSSSLIKPPQQQTINGDIDAEINEPEDEVPNAEKKQKWELHPDITWGQIVDSFSSVLRRSNPATRGKKITNDWEAASSGVLADDFDIDGLNDLTFDQPGSTGVLKGEKSPRFIRSLDEAGEPKSGKQRRSFTLAKSYSVKWSEKSKHRFAVDDEAQKPSETPKRVSRTKQNGIDTTEDEDDDDMLTPCPMTAMPFSTPVSPRESIGSIQSRGSYGNKGETPIETPQPLQASEEARSTQRRTSGKPIGVSRLCVARVDGSCCTDACMTSAEVEPKAAICITARIDPIPDLNSPHLEKGATIITVCSNQLIERKQKGLSKPKPKRLKACKDKSTVDGDPTDASHSKFQNSKSKDEKKHHRLAEDATQSIDCHHHSSHVEESTVLSSCIVQTRKTFETNLPIPEETFGYGIDASLGVSPQPSPHMRSHKRLHDQAMATQCPNHPVSLQHSAEPDVSPASSEMRKLPICTRNLQKPVHVCYQAENRKEEQPATTSFYYTDDERQRFEARLGMTPAQNDAYYASDASCDGFCHCGQCHSHCQQHSPR